MGHDRWDVFISYGHEDADWVGTLADNLHRDGFDVFFDQWEIIGGDRVTGRLEVGLRGATYGVLVVSPHSLSRPWVMEEYEALLAQAVANPGRRLIAVLYRDCELPPFLASRRWVDFRGVSSAATYDRALEELERALRERAASDRPARGSPRQWPKHGEEPMRPAGPMRLRLSISKDEVSLRDDSSELAVGVPKVEPATIQAIKDLDRCWGRSSVVGDSDDELLERVGRCLTANFLAGDVGMALNQHLAVALAANELLELGIETPGLEFVPWETLLVPFEDRDAAARRPTPLVLHRNLALHRTVSGLGAVPAYRVRGPLRILVAIASPDSSDRVGELLNYEAELARIIGAVDPARRRGEAYVRVLTEGSVGAIREALTNDPEGFHVLHLSCHARPGVLILEDAEGREDRVSADRLLAEALPAGTDLPMVVLSGCSTGLADRRSTSAGAGNDEVPRRRLAPGGVVAPDNAEGEQELPAVGEALLRAGVPVVLAMQAPVSDQYATELVGELYGHLASAAVPDPLVALSEARRRVERARLALPADGPGRPRADWATPTLLVRGSRLPLFRRDEQFADIARPVPPSFVEGVVVRRVGEFVGRRRELREARRILRGDTAGLVVNAIGGVGKSTLAAEMIATLASEVGAIISMHGAISVDSLFAEIGARLRHVLPAHDERQAVAAELRSTDVEWIDRWRALSELLPSLPMIVLLDNFEDNLSDEGVPRQVRGPELADLLARWVQRPGQSKLLITSRHPMALPDGAHRRLASMHLGPLSEAETAKLVWQLPGIDALPFNDRKRAYRDVGGHPRTLEYLDALLSGGQARFHDIAERMERTLRDRGIADPGAWMATRDQALGSSLSEAVTLAVDEVMLNELLTDVARTALARDLVISAAVYRVPIDHTGLVWQLVDEVRQLSDPEREARMLRISDAIRAGTAEAIEQLADDLGLQPEEILAAYQADWDARTLPPASAPDGFDRALTAAVATGLISPLRLPDNRVAYVVHRWTAATLALLDPVVTARAHKRAALYWRWRLEVGGPLQIEDLEEIMEARHHYHAAGELEEAVLMSELAMWQLETWGSYGRAAEVGRDTLEWVPEGTVQAAGLLMMLGINAQHRGDVSRAELLLGQVLEISERRGDVAAAVGALDHLAQIAQTRGDYDTAARRYRQAIEIGERLGDEADLSGTWGNLGHLAHDRGDYAAAEQLYTKALQAHVRDRDQSGAGTMHHQLGVLAKDRGDYAGAEQHHTAALQIFQRLGHQEGLAKNLHQLGLVAFMRGDYDRAEHRYAQALEVFEQLDGHDGGVASQYHQLGMLAQLRGDDDTATRRYRQSLEIFERIGSQSGVAKSCSSLGTVAQGCGDYDGAASLYARSLQISEQRGDLANLATTHLRLGMLAQDQGDQDAAQHRYTTSIELSEQDGNPELIATTCAALAALMTERGDPDAAIPYDLRALGLSIRMGVLQVYADSAHRVGQARLRLGATALARIASQSLDEESLAVLTTLFEDLDERSDPVDHRPTSNPRRDDVHES